MNRQALRLAADENLTANKFVPMQANVTINNFATNDNRKPTNLIPSINTSIIAVLDI